MKATISIILFCIGTTVGAIDPPVTETDSGNTSADAVYQLVKQEDNISIYTRWLPVDEKRSARQVKVTFAVDAPASEALAVLFDDASFTSWMKGTRDYHRLHTVDSGNWYSYIQFSIPWPLNDQDCVIHYEIRTQSDTYTEIFLNGEPEYLSAYEGVMRISHMEGTWKFVSSGSERTLVEYVIFSRQPSSFPRWITDPIIQNNMIKTMTAFRERVGQVEGERRGK